MFTLSGSPSVLLPLLLRYVQAVGPLLSFLVRRNVYCRPGKGMGVLEAWELFVCAYTPSKSSRAFCFADRSSALLSGLYGPFPSLKQP